MFINNFKFISIFYLMFFCTISFSNYQESQTKLYNAINNIDFAELKRLVEEDKVDLHCSFAGQFPNFSALEGALNLQMKDFDNGHFGPPYIQLIQYLIPLTSTTALKKSLSYTLVNYNTVCDYIRKFINLKSKCNELSSDGTILNVIKVRCEQIIKMINEEISSRKQPTKLKIQRKS